jgi:hypothetical protein
MEHRWGGVTGSPDSVPPLDDEGRDGR